MNKVVVITRNTQHYINWLRHSGLAHNSNKFILVGTVKNDHHKLAGLPRGLHYIEIDTPVDYSHYEKIMQILRARGAERLSLDVNQWPITLFA